MKNRTYSVCSVLLCSFSGQKILVQIQCTGVDFPGRSAIIKNANELQIQMSCILHLDVYRYDEKGEHMQEVLLEALIDSLRLIPFLFVTYFAMGILEHATSDKAHQLIKKAGRFGPIWGSIVGAVPQCGLSAAASYFYVGRVLTLGTLISIYMSTSDEMLPILISEKVAGSVIVKILLVKIFIGMVSGFLIELLFGWMARRKKVPKEFELNEIHGHCCGGSVLVEAVRHTLKVFIFVLLVSVAIGTAIFVIGEDTLAVLVADIPVLGEAVAALIGLIPNCAASVVITQLYLDGIIGAGPMMSGLLVSAGVGLLVLFKENRHMHENVIIVALLYAASVAWGVAIEVLGITF